MKLFNGKKGVMKIISLVAVFVLLFSFISISLDAQNETNETNSTIEDVEEPQPSEENSVNETNENVESDEPVVNEFSNESISESSENVSEETSTNETSANETNNETNIPSENIEAEQNIEMNIVFPDKIIRGEDFEIKIEITNTGKNVSNSFILQTILPEGLESSKENRVEEILPGEKTSVSKTLSSSLSTEIGLNEIKFILNKNG